MRWLSVLPAFLAGAAVYIWVPLERWSDFHNGLLAFLGLLAASIVQIIPVTANFIQSDQLNPKEAENLSRALEKQQSFWIAFLTLIFITMLLLVLGGIFSKKLSWEIPRVGHVDASHAVSSVIAFFLVLVVTKSFSIYPGVSSLQRLRSRLVIEAAKRRAAEKVQCDELQRQSHKSITPKGYGEMTKQ